MVKQKVIVEAGGEGTTVTVGSGTKSSDVIPASQMNEIDREEAETDSKVAAYMKTPLTNVPAKGKDEEEKTDAPENKGDPVVGGGGDPEEDDKEKMKAKLGALIDNTETVIGRTKIDALKDPIDFIGKANELYEKIKIFNENLLGVGSPEQAGAYRGQVGGDLKKDFSGGMVQFDKLKYDQAQALSRTMLASALSGIFQAASPSAGVVQTAMGDSVAGGINEIQARQDLVDQQNRIYDAKNAEYALKYYDDAVGWDKDYNRLYNQNEQMKNAFAISMIKQVSDNYKAVIDDYKEMYKENLGKAETQEKDEKTRNLEQAKLDASWKKSQAELDQKANDKKIEYIKLWNELNKQVEEGMLSPGIPERIAGVSKTLGMDPDSFTTALYTKMTPKQKTEFYNNYGELLNNQIETGSFVVKSVFKKDFFEFGRDKKARAAFNTMAAFRKAGWLIDETAARTIANLIKNDTDIQFNSSILSGKYSISNPTIKRLIENNNLIQGISEDKKISGENIPKALDYLNKLSDANVVTDSKGNVTVKDEALQQQINAGYEEIRSAANLKSLQDQAIPLKEARIIGSLVNAGVANEVGNLLESGSWRNTKNWNTLGLKDPVYEERIQLDEPPKTAVKKEKTEPEKED
jgi:hypothetical protein